MAGILPPVPWDRPQTSFEWVDWYTKLRDVIDNSALDHNSLTGLQGGNTTERYHLTNAQVSLVTGAEQTANKNAANGYAGLNASSLVLPQYLGSGTRDGTKFLLDDGTWRLPWKLRGNDNGAGLGETVTIQAGSSSGANAGGPVDINAGGSATGNCGAVNITGGVSAAGTPGRVNITGGYGNTTSTTGAKVVITGGLAGSAVNAVGGDVEIVGGFGGNGGRGGHVLIRPGVSASGVAVYGNIQLDGGRGGALGTTATAGFVTVPTCAGAPTGVPVGVPTGSVATVVDTTNLRAYFYIAGTWRYAQLV